MKENETETGYAVAYPHTSLQPHVLKCQKSHKEKYLGSTLGDVKVQINDIVRKINESAKW